MAETAQLRLSDLIEPKFILRAVDKMTAGFLSLKDSIKEFGFHGAIDVRPAPEGRRHLGKYEIVDGLMRCTASKEVGLQAIPATITPMTDEEVIRFQVIANAVRIETHPCEYARHIKRIQELHPEWSLRKIAASLKKDDSWLWNIYQLNNLVPAIQTLVDQGDINVTNAWELARLPTRKQNDFIEPAGILSSKEFKELIRQVRRTHLYGWTRKITGPKPCLRPLLHIINERKAKRSIPQLLALTNAKTQLEVIDVTLDWVMKMDPVTFEQRRQRRGVKQDLRQTYRDDHEINPHT